MSKTTLEEIKEKICGRDIEILSTEYIRQDKKLKCKCLNNECNNIWETSWISLRSGSGCPICSKNIVTEENCLATIRPDLIKYFENEADSHKAMPSSKKIWKLKCPDCGNYKEMSTNQLNRYGFGCRYCSDGVSIPNKFLSNILRQLFNESDYDLEKTIRDTGYRYDGWFILNGVEYYCEAHGEIHYTKGFSNKGAKTLQETIINDINKKTYIESLGHKYIGIDCRVSDFDFLKESYIKSFEGILDISEINWVDIYEKCSSSLVVQVANYYNQTHETPMQIGRVFKLERCTVRDYLKRASKLGLTDYKSIKAEDNCRNVCQFTLDGEYLNTFNSVRSAAKILGLHESTIRRVANKTRRAMSGFSWIYEDEYLKMDCKEE